MQRVSWTLVTFQAAYTVTCLILGTFPVPWFLPRKADVRNRVLAAIPNVLLHARMRAEYRGGALHRPGPARPEAVSDQTWSALCSRRQSPLLQSGMGCLRTGGERGLQVEYTCHVRAGTDRYQGCKHLAFIAQGRTTNHLNCDRHVSELYSTHERI